MTYLTISINAVDFQEDHNTDSIINEGSVCIFWPLELRTYRVNLQTACLILLH